MCFCCILPYFAITCEPRDGPPRVSFIACCRLGAAVGEVPVTWLWIAVAAGCKLPPSCRASPAAPSPRIKGLSLLSFCIKGIRLFCYYVYKLPSIPRYRCIIWAAASSSLLATLTKPLALYFVSNPVRLAELASEFVSALLVAVLTRFSPRAAGSN